MDARIATSNGGIRSATSAWRSDGTEVVKIRTLAITSDSTDLRVTLPNTCNPTVVTCNQPQCQRTVPPPRNNVPTSTILINTDSIATRLHRTARVTRLHSAITPTTPA